MKGERNMKTKIRIGFNYIIEILVTTGDSVVIDLYHMSYYLI